MADAAHERVGSPSLRPLGEGDEAWVEAFVRERWGAPEVVARGRMIRPAGLPGFAAYDGETLVGLVTYRVEDGDCEVVTIDSLREGAGIGSALMGAVVDAAREGGCRRVWLITTNDNLRALRFYQRRGFRLAALHRDALEESRRLKPQIPLVGDHGIPLRDELELELLLE